MPRWTSAAALSMAALFAAGAADAATNLVQDGGFELTETTPWTVGSGWTVDVGDSHGGQGVARGGCIGAACLDRDSEGGAGSLSQTIAGLTAGQVYTLSFFFTPTGVESGETLTPNALRVFWGDREVVSFADVTDQGYAFYSFDVTATSVVQTLEFLARNDPGYQLLDDVSLVARETTSAAPEPATWALMILGFGGAGGALRRRRWAAA